MTWLLMITNKEFNSTVIELFVRGRKLNILLVSITPSYFKEQRNVGRNCTYSFYYKNFK